MSTTTKNDVFRPQVKNFISSKVEELISVAEDKIVDKNLYQLFTNAFANTLDTTVTYSYENQNHDTYVITGDIDAMWLRDSTAQVWSYLPLIKYEENLRFLIVGVINRQAQYIRLDPYANAFNYDNNGSIWSEDLTIQNPHIHERKWELDSLCYHIRLVDAYYLLTQDKSIFTQQWLDTAKVIYATFKKQQLYTGGCYTFQRKTTVATDTLADHGLGNPVNPVGLIASAFRPSDDATILPFLVPANFFAVVSLRQMAHIVKLVYLDDSFSLQCTELANVVEQALYEFAVITHKKYGKIIAYEVDGYGGQILMDDANIPSLLSLPYLGCINVEDELYKNTRKFILSTDNPWYFLGKDISGIGSIHTGRNRVWPLAVIMQGLTSTNKNEVDACIHLVCSSHADTFFVHEAINKDNQYDYSRKWFAWANSLFAELVMWHYGII